jgi:hypothetical protein
MTNKTKLLEFVSENHGLKSLEETVIVGCQHLLNGNYEMIKQLQKNGLKPKNVFLIGKSYSSNSEIMKQFKEFGVHIHNYEYNSHMPFDQLFDEEISIFLDKVNNSRELKNARKVVCIDDGGGILSRIHNLDHKQITGVEQTSSGYHKLKNYNKIPILNIARSHAKLTYETPHIVDCFLTHLQKHIKKLGMNPQKALIMGRGVIGSEIQRKLPLDSFVYEGGSINNEELSSIISEHDLIIGASGNTSIPFTHHDQIKKGTILASISSSDREFDAVYMRKKHPITNDPHKNYNYNGTYLLNGGFPINFDGNSTSVPTRYIQLTHALMMEGIFESMRLNKVGMYHLPRTKQETIVNKFKDIVHIYFYLSR